MIHDFQEMLSDTEDMGSCFGKISTGDEATGEWKPACRIKVRLTQSELVELQSQTKGSDMWRVTVDESERGK